MPRYFTRPRNSRPKADWEPWMDEHPLLPGLTVNDHEAVETGLVDRRGDPIMRGPNPMGFVWRD